MNKISAIGKGKMIIGQGHYAPGEQPPGTDIWGQLPQTPKQPTQFVPHELADLSGELRNMVDWIKSILAKSPPPDVQTYLLNLLQYMQQAIPKLKSMGSY